MKHYYIFRLAGTDYAVTDDAEKARIAYEYMKKNCEEGKTELNFYTTTYNFNVKV